VIFRVRGARFDVRLLSLRALIAYAFFSLSALAEDIPILAINGEVERPLLLSAKQIRDMNHVTVTVTEHNGLVSEYEGVPLVSLLESAGLAFGKALRGKRLATYVLVQARDGYAAVFALPGLDPAFNDRMIFLAYSKNGGALPLEEAPLRVIVSSEKREARWIRQVVALKIISVGSQ
jgi:DMSO/TMAO reductase YedYZ molybdopterin-dependent catalytic subunit